jgi:tripartite-type tricarboxylate transporter receptor subunit TctC
VRSGRRSSAAAERALHCRKHHGDGDGDNNDDDEKETPMNHQRPHAPLAAGSALRRRTVLAAAASATASLAAPSILQAQERWPSRPVTVVSPYNPGGTNDVVARLVADRLQKALGQPFVIENKPGAAGVVGTQAVMRAKPDGYTLLSANNGALVIQSAGRDPSPYDGARQFTPIMKVVDAAQFIAVSSDLPVQTVGELIALARKEPGKLNFSSAGVGSYGHFVGEYLKLLTGTELLHVPSKGSAAALTEMMAHRIQMMIDPIVLTQASDGRIRVLATLNSRRVETHPQIPTITESGGPAVDLAGWFGLVGPAGLPDEVVERIAAVGKEIVSDPDARKQFAGSGLLPSLLTGKAFGDLIKADLVKVADVRTRAKIQLE